MRARIQRLQSFGPGSNNIVQWSSRCLPIRSIATSRSLSEDVQTHSTAVNSHPPPPPSSKPLTPRQIALLEKIDPTTAHTRREESVLMRQGNPPIGSRRRRAAIASSAGIPFEQLPYQCFQEARKVLQEDRLEKLAQIATQRGRIERLKSQEADNAAAIKSKELRLKSMRKHLEELKILADVNDPLVKKRFEDDKGDLNRPIYRYYAERKWRSYRRKILMQRIEQMNIVPDILPNLDMTYDMHLNFGRSIAHPGAFVLSSLSERAPRLILQPFDKGERLVTIAIVDPDVPNLETNGFDSRCHFLAMNIPVSPTDTKIDFRDYVEDAEISKNRLVHSYSPPYAQLGSPYHRLCIMVLQQHDNAQLDVEKVKQRYGKREGFTLRSLLGGISMKPVAAFLWRTQWDESMDAVMTRLGVEGVGEQLKRKRVEPLPYKRKPSDSERYR